MTDNRTTAGSFYSQDRYAYRIAHQRRTRKGTIIANPVRYDLTFMANTLSLELFNGASRRRYCKSLRDDTASSDRNDTASPKGTILHL